MLKTVRQAFLLLRDIHVVPGYSVLAMLLAPLIELCLEALHGPLELSLYLVSVRDA